MIKNKVSIICNAKNEGEYLKRTVDHIVQYTEYPHYEIILVDDGSTDASFKSIDPKHYKIPIKIIHNKESIGVVKSRNQGAKMATGEYLIFIDGHVFPSSNWITELVHAANKSNGGMSVPNVITLQEKKHVPNGKIFTFTFTDYYLNTGGIFEDKSEIYEVPLAIGCSYLIKREVFDEILGYTSEFIGVGRDELDLCIKTWLSGYKIYATPHTYVEHLVRKAGEPGYHYNHFDLIYNTLCFGYLYFSKDNFTRMIYTAKRFHYFPEALAAIMQNENLPILKKQYKAIFKYDDVWFFEKFKLYFEDMKINYRLLFKHRIHEIIDGIKSSFFSEGNQFLDKDPKILAFKETTALTNDDIMALIKESIKV